MKENVVRIDVCVCLQCCLLAVCPTTPTMFAQTKIVFISVTYLLLRVLFKNMRFMRIVYCCRQTLNRSARRKHVLHRFAHFLSLFCVNRHRVISILNCYFASLSSIVIIMLLLVPMLDSRSTQNMELLLFL